MGLPVPSFAALTAGDQPLSLFDQQFNAIAQGGTIACTAVGQNTIALTPNPNNFVPSIYTDGAPRFVWVQQSTTIAGPVTINVAGLGALTAYKQNGQIALGSIAGELVTGGVYTGTYSSALTAGAGGIAVDLNAPGPPGPPGPQGPPGVQGPGGPTSGLPAGGATGTVLTKNSGADYDTIWSSSVGASVPTGGTAGQALTKNSATNFDTGWSGPFLPLAGGTLTGNVTLSYTGANATFFINGDATHNKQLTFQNGGSTRWTIFSDATTESGGNTGSAFSIGRCNDAGVYIDSPIAIVRASGAVAITGTSTNDSAPAGRLGEYLEQFTAWGSSIGLSTGVWAGINSVTLSAGDWDVTGNVTFAGGATTRVYILQVSLSLTNGTFDNSPSRRSTTGDNGQTIFTNGSVETQMVGPSRFSLAASATVFVTCYASFDTSTCSVYAAHIRARRVR